MLVSDTAAVQQIINIKHDEDKLVQIDPHKIMGLAGRAPKLRALSISPPISLFLTICVQFKLLCPFHERIISTTAACRKTFIGVGGMRFD